MEVSLGVRGATLARASATSMARWATQGNATATSAAPEATPTVANATSMADKATQGAPTRTPMATNVQPARGTLPPAVLDRPPMPVAAFLLVVCAQALTLASEDRDPYPAIVPLDAEHHVSPRLLWGLGARGGLALLGITVEGPCPGPGICSPDTGLYPSVDGALYLRVGAEFNDMWGVEGELHGGLFTQGGYVGGALTIDATPVDWFTVAVGPMVDEYESLSAGTSFATPTAVGGTLRLDFHLLAARTTTGRSAFTFGFVGDVAAAFGPNHTAAESQPASAVYVTIGYAHY